MAANPTKAEKALLDGLTDKQIPFQNQILLLGYIPDFYFPDHKLIVEVDGSSHKGREKEDARRDESFRVQGYHIMHFSNRRVLQDLDGVIVEIAKRFDPQKPRKGKYKFGEHPKGMAG